MKKSLALANPSRSKVIESGLRSAGATTFSPKNGSSIDDIEYSETVHDQVYLTLRRQLMNGSLKPGQAISIRYLTKKYNVSATPAREALNRLQAERALVVGSNRTPTVPLPSRKDLRELRDVRMSLEGLAAEQATTLITPEELDEIDIHCKNMEAAIKGNDNNGYLHSNWAFHRVIYKAAQSELMMDIIETLWMRAGPLIRLALQGEGHMQHYMKHHTGALEALRCGDPTAVRTAIETDISSAAADLESTLTQ